MSTEAKPIGALDTKTADAIWDVINEVRDHDESTDNIMELITPMIEAHARAVAATEIRRLTTSRVFRDLQAEIREVAARLDA